MSDRRWIGFDLDDTLHDMSRVQEMADLLVFDEVSGKCGRSPEDLRALYRAVNSKHLSPDFFANGWSADEHRSLRFRTLFDHIGLHDDGLIQQCLEIYYVAFTRYAELYPGVEGVLQSLRSQGYQIAIVTERPHDSAEHMLQCLGLDPFVDLLVTVGGERLSKPNGLFERALHHMGPVDTKVHLVGDKLDRDIRPALASGMNPIWYVHPSKMPETLPDDISDAVTLINDHREILAII